MPVKIQGIITAKTSTMQDVYTDVLAKLATDSSTRQFMEDLYQSEMRPMLHEVIEEGKSQGYINPDIPEEAIMIYLDMFKDAGMANPRRLQHLMENSELLMGLTRLIYYGLFQKEFDFTIDFNAEKEWK